jgi:hypothetical protein
VNNESWLIPARQLCWSKKTFHSRNLGEAPTQEKQSKDAAVENWSLRWWATTVLVRMSN